MSELLHLAYNNIKIQTKKIIMNSLLIRTQKYNKNTSKDMTPCYFKGMVQDKKFSMMLLETKTSIQEQNSEENDEKTHFSSGNE